MSQPDEKAPPAALCKCGHEKGTHRNSRGACWSVARPGSTAYRCPCRRYHAANKAIPLSPALRLATGRKTRLPMPSDGIKPPAKALGIVANLPHPKLPAGLALSGPRMSKAEAADQQKALAYLRKSVPEFFGDPLKLCIAAEIIRQMPEEMAMLKPVDRASAVAAIMGLMYDMSTATTRYIHGGHKSVGESFLELCRDKRASAKGGE